MNITHSNKVYVTHPPFPFAQEEIELIEKTLRFEGYDPIAVYPKTEQFNKYYKGGRPAILFYEELDKDPTVFYGFWSFVNFFINHGMMRC